MRQNVVAHLFMRCSSDGHRLYDTCRGEMGIGTLEAKSLRFPSHTIRLVSIPKSLHAYYFRESRLLERYYWERTHCPGSTTITVPAHRGHCVGCTAPLNVSVVGSRRTAPGLTIIAGNRSGAAESPQIADLPLLEVATTLGEDPPPSGVQ